MLDIKNEKMWWKKLSELAFIDNSRWLSQITQYGG